MEDRGHRAVGCVDDRDGRVIPEGTIPSESSPVVPWGTAARARLARRQWPIMAMFVMLAAGMAFMFAWDPVVHHNGSWSTGSDLWGIFRGAHYVGWGFVGGIYTPSDGIITFPGMTILLAPVAMLAGHLHMTESFMPYLLRHPTAALVLQPIELLLASTVVFATDALAERLVVSKRRRILLCFLVGIIAWPTAAVWGHAEDALAVTFAVYAMLAFLDRKWSKAGWLFGFGIVVQPLVALMLPLFIGAIPAGRRIALAVRSAALSVVLVGVAFAGNAGDTYRALVKQPTPPSVNHATPWVALAPKIPPASVPVTHQVSLVPGLGHPSLTSVTVAVHPVTLVAGGPGRSIDVIVAILFGIYVWRRPQHAIRLLWLAAAVLASRCFFEAVMTPYYIAPPLFLALVLASRQGGKRFWAAAVIALEITVLAYYHLNPWVWWLCIVAGLAGTLALSYPNDLTSTSGPPAGASSTSAPVEPETEIAEPIRSLEPAL